MNKRGFTLVEMLAVVALLGILMGIAIGAVSGYRDKASNQTYDSIFKASSSACEIYIMDNNLEISLKDGSSANVTLDELVEGHYMTEPIDPNSKSKCSGKVEYKMKRGSGSKQDYIVYRVTLNCPGKSIAPRIFPEGETF